MKKIEKVLNEQKIINKAKLAEKIGMSKQHLNNKIKGNNNLFITDAEKSLIKAEISNVLTEVLKT